MATTTLTIGEQNLEVASLPENIQRIVAAYDEAVVRAQAAEQDLIHSSSASKWLFHEINRLVSAMLTEQEEGSEEGESVVEEDTAEV